MGVTVWKPLIFHGIEEMCHAREDSQGLLSKSGSCCILDELKVCILVPLGSSLSDSKSQGLKSWEKLGEVLSSCSTLAGLVLSARVPHCFTCSQVTLTKTPECFSCPDARDWR